MAEPGDWSGPLYAAVGLLAIKLITNGVEATLQRWRQEAFLLKNIRAEIQRTRLQNQETIKVLVHGLDFGVFKQRMISDEKYYIFFTFGERNPTVFNSNAKELSGLSLTTSELLIAFFETQSLIAATVDGLKSEDFRNLVAERKIAAIEGLCDLLKENDATALKCEVRFRRVQKNPWLVACED